MKTTISNTTENKNFVSLKDCIHGFLYEINSRNLSFGVFNSKNNAFIGLRTKFRDTFLFTEYHYETGAPFGTVYPIKKLSQLPEHISISEYIIDPKTGASSFARRNGIETFVIRNNLKLEDPPHGKRSLFEDIWYDTKERLPDNLYPYTISNTDLENYLTSSIEKYQKEP